MRTFGHSSIDVLLEVSIHRQVTGGLPKEGVIVTWGRPLESCCGTETIPVSWVDANQIDHVRHFRNPPDELQRQ